MNIKGRTRVWRVISKVRMLSVGAGLCLSLCVVAAYSAGSTAGGDDSTNTKSKRDVSGLFPFPRVGRSELEYEHDLDKRQGLIPFPRVGRAGWKRDGIPAGSGGMWFGPRLGRMHKRDIPSNGGWALIQLRDFSSSKGRPIVRENFTPRLGRDSIEEYQTENEDGKDTPTNV